MVATLVTITKESPRAIGHSDKQQQILIEIDNYNNYNKEKPEGDRPWQ
jgi:hypothetical protein